MSECMTAAEALPLMAKGRKRRVTPETALKRQAKEYLTFKGWRHWWHLQSIGTYPGLPDIEAIKEGRVLYIETKAPRGKLSPAQEEFRDMIQEAGGTYWTIYSLDELIERLREG